MTTPYFHLRSDYWELLLHRELVDITVRLAIAALPVAHFVRRLACFAPSICQFFPSTSLEVLYGAEMAWRALPLVKPGKPRRS